MSIYERADKNYHESFFCMREKRRAKKRDNNQCQICHRKEHLEIHHVIPMMMIRYDHEIRFFNSQFNFVTLCHPCHRKLHLGYIFYPKYLKCRCDINNLMKRCRIGEKARLKAQENKLNYYHWLLIRTLIDLTQDKNMKTYKIPVIWQVAGFCTIKAESLDATIAAELFVWHRSWRRILVSQNRR